MSAAPAGRGEAVAGAPAGRGRAVAEGPGARRVAVVLGAACVFVPLAAWLPGQPRPALQQGGWMTLAAAVFVLWTALARRRVPLAPGSALVGGALLLSLVPLWGEPWLQVRGALAERAPLAAGWLLLGAARAWPGLAVPLVDALVFVAILVFGTLTGGWPGFAQAGVPVAPWAPFADADAQAAFPLLLALAAVGLWRVRAASPDRGLVPLRPVDLLLLFAACGWCGWLGLASARAGALLGLAVGWRRGALRAGTAALAAGVYAAGELLRVALPAEADGETATAAVTHDRAAEVRVAVHAAALGRALEAPQGVGAGRWALDYPYWRPLAEAQAALEAGAASAPPPPGPRDELMLALVEGGYGATLLLLAAACILLRRLAASVPPAAADSAEQGGDPLPMLAALAGFCALAAPLSGAPPVLAAAALLAGALRPLPAPPREQPAGTPRHAATAVALGAALLAALPATAQIRGERALGRALADFQGDPEEHLADSAAARPWDPRPWYLLGGVARELESWPEARALLARARDADPTHLGALTAGWMVEMLAPDGDREAGFALLERAEALAPWHPAVRGARPAWLRAVRDMHLEEARAMLAQGASARVRTLTCSAYLADARIALLQGERDKARAALELAAPLSEGSARLRIERLARDEQVAEATVAALVRRLWPQWPDL